MDSLVITKYKEILERDKLPPRIAVKELLERVKKDKMEIAKLMVENDYQKNIIDRQAEQLLATTNYYKTKIMSIQKDLKKELEINSDYTNKIERFVMENDSIIRDRNNLILLVNELQSKTLISKINKLIYSHRKSK